MSQYRTFEFDADDSTFDLNQRLLEMIQPGLYHGFDLLNPSGLTLVLEHTATGVITVDEDELETPPKGVYVTKQGVTIKEDANIQIPVDVGGALPRIDLVIAEHLYQQITGGNPAIYSIIKGTQAAIPVAPSLTNPRRQTILGYLYIPANMSGLEDTEVVYTKSIQPDFAGNGFRARIETLEQRADNSDVAIGERLIAANNLSDLQSASQARNNLDLGNHVTHDYFSGTNSGSANSIARGDHSHNGVYEPVFSKNTGFNKNFGSTSGTVCQGNDGRLTNSRTCNNNFDNAQTSRTNLGLGNHSTHNYATGTNAGSANSVSRGDHGHAPGDINGTLSSGQIPNLDASKITTGTLSVARIPSLDASKTTTGTFNSARIPSLDASKIGSGTLNTARIPSLDASKITTGTLSTSRIPNLAATKITSGVFSSDRIPSITSSKLADQDYIDFVNKTSPVTGAGTTYSRVSGTNTGVYYNTTLYYRTYLKGSYANLLLQHQFTGALACPYVYIKYNGEYVYFNEIIKDAKYPHNEKSETLKIPEYLIDETGVLEIMIKEVKEEVSYINSVVLAAGGKTNVAKEAKDKDIVLRQNEDIKLKFKVSKEDKDKVFLTCTGFYVPLKKAI